MSDLIGRLEALGPTEAPGDWTDVVARAHRRRRRTLRRRMIVAVAFAILAVPALAIATGKVDFLSLSLTEDDVPPPESAAPLGYTIGDELRLPGRPPAKLADSVLAPFLGKRAALVVPSPDGRRIVYHAWAGGHERGTPMLRVFDTEAGEDEVLERGTQGIAWGADGRIAYAKALVPQYENTPQGATGGQIGHVVVRDSLEGEPVRWTTSATQYFVHAWAGRQLIVSARASSVFHGPEPESGVYSFSGPRRSRRLPIAEVLAVSPDGRFVLGPARAQDEVEQRSRLRIVRAATGQVAAELGLRRGAYSLGSWSGRTIILGSGVGTARGLVVLRYEARRLMLDRVLKLKDEVAEATGIRPPFSLTLGQPVFVDDSAREFMVELTLLQTGVRGTSLWLTCDLIARRCRRGHSIEPPTRWAALVYNPSRPLPD